MLLHNLRILFLLLLFSIQSFAQEISPQLVQYLDMVRSEFSGENALATTAYVSGFWRSPGNAGFDSSIYRVQRILEAAGYQEENTSPVSRERSCWETR